jgi:hypothetical protein
MDCLQNSSKLIIGGEVIKCRGSAALTLDRIVRYKSKEIESHSDTAKLYEIEGVLFTALPKLCLFTEHIDVLPWLASNINRQFILHKSQM